MFIDRRQTVVHQQWKQLHRFRSTNGKILWHAGLTATPSNGPMTYMSTGKQYVLVAAGDTLYTRFELKPLVDWVARSRDLIKNG